MSNRDVLSQKVVLGALLLFALLAAGCGSREAELEKMAKCLQSNTGTRSAGNGLRLDTWFWVDEKRTIKMTLREKLIEVQASLYEGKVYDPAGRELFFYEGDTYVEKQHSNPNWIKEEIQRLEKDYRVIRIFFRHPKN